MVEPRPEGTVLRVTVPDPIDPVFFPTPEDLRSWLQAHGDTLDVAWIGLYKKASERPSVTWPELVDQLLCFGWIDGLRKSWDDESYVIRITPRRPGSNWSPRNRGRVSTLLGAGLMEPAGLRAWEARDPIEESSAGGEDPELSRAHLEEFQAHSGAWEYFLAQPPSYRKLATKWVVTAERKSTRRRRLKTLITDSAAGRRIAPLRRG